MRRGASGENPRPREVQLIMDLEAPTPAKSGSTPPDRTDQRPSVQHYLSVQWLILALALLTIGGVIGYSLLQEHSRIEEQDRALGRRPVRLVNHLIGSEVEHRAAVVPVSGRPERQQHLPSDRLVVER